MTLLTCHYKGTCTLAALIISAIIGVIAAFLQITGTVIITAAALTVAFGIAIGYLGLLALGTVLARRTEPRDCTCTALTAVLAGILGTILFAIIQLAVGIIATSVISALLTGLLVFFFTLTVTGTACYIRCLTDCAE